MCVVASRIITSSFADISPASFFFFNRKNLISFSGVSLFIGLEEYFDCLKVLAVVNKVSRNTHVQIFG